MNLISIAQQSGEVSADVYVKYSAMGPIEPPSMSGVDQLVAKMQQETQNPFLSSGFSNQDKPPLGPERQRPPVLGIPAGPSPRSSQVRSTHPCPSHVYDCMPRLHQGRLVHFHHADDGCCNCVFS